MVRAARMAQTPAARRGASQCRMHVLHSPRYCVACVVMLFCLPQAEARRQAEELMLTGRYAEALRHNVFWSNSRTWAEARKVRGKGGAGKGDGHWAVTDLAAVLVSGAVPLHGWGGDALAVAAPGWECWRAVPRPRREHPLPGPQSACLHQTCLQEMAQGRYTPVLDPGTEHCLSVLPWWSGRGMVH